MIDHYLLIEHISRPETFTQRPTAELTHTVTDVSGNEDKYTLDSHGFQIYKHAANEKEFVDEEKIKDGYYKEVEQLIKDA
jgi:hypothetical protein